MNILVLDDYKDICTLAKMWLVSLGHTVDVFESPGAAIRSVAENKYDAVLSDYSLCHRVSGNGFLAACRLFQPKINLVLMTGSILPEELYQYEQNWDILLSKPEDFNESKLEEIFGNKKANEASSQDEEEREED